MYILCARNCEVPKKLVEILNQIKKMDEFHIPSHFTIIITKIIHICTR